jgi:branched-chain amino acid transport system ATP-binding protein
MTSQPDPILVVSGVQKSFGAVHAVRGVSMSVAQGESVSIIGPNGAGKSTLFGLIAGEHLPSDGSIEYSGKDVTSWSAARLARRGLSRTFQVARFFGSRTVLDNLIIASIAGCGRPFRIWDDYAGAGVHRERAHRVLQELSLSGLRTTEAQFLAQGDRKRLELAMALVQEPRLLLLDEPTAGMSLEDTATTIRLLSAIKAGHGDMTIVLTAHDMDVVFALSDRVILMGQGQVVIEGTPAEVERAPETRELYLGGVGE